MAVKRNGSSERFTIGLTLALLMICALVSVVAINLVVIPFMNASNQQAISSGAIPQIAKATATIDFEQGPPPPGTPTGEPPPRLPIPDRTQLMRAPTGVVPADVPTLEPIEEIDSVPPTFAPLNAVAPSDKWVTYEDSNLGFSFEYPQNWVLDGPERMKKGNRVSITVRNYDDVMTKGDKTVEQLKIDISVLDLPEPMSNLNDWVTKYRDPNVAGLDAAVSLTPIENMNINGVPAVRWIQTAPMIPQGNIIVGFVKDKKLGVVSAYPATSKYVSALDRIISSFQLP